MWHTPAPSAIIDSRQHLLAYLDQVECDEDLVDRDQLGPLFSIEGGFRLLAREGVAPVRGLVAPVGPDGVGVEESDTLEADQWCVLGDDVVPVPEPATASGVNASASLGRGLIFGG